VVNLRESEKKKKKKKKKKGKKPLTFEQSEFALVPV